MYSRQYLNEQYKHSVILSPLFVGMCRCYEKLDSDRQLLSYHRDYMKSTSANVLVSDKGTSIYLYTVDGAQCFGLIPLLSLEVINCLVIISMMRNPPSESNTSYLSFFLKE